MIKLFSHFRNSQRPVLMPVLCLMSLVFLLLSCASPPQPRPKVIEDAEYYLQQGTAAYFNDEYPQAAEQFSRAIKLYQSIDNQPGIINAYTNLVETSIAISNYSLARTQLDQLNELMLDESYKKYRVRVKLLIVKLLFNEEHYSEAIAQLSPLLPDFDDRHRVKKIDKNTLNIVSAMTRLAIRTDSDKRTIWLQRFQQAMQQIDQPGLRYTALLYRLQAQLKQKQGLFAESRELLEKALSIHHRLSYRRGIAADLQQMADLELQQQHWVLADNLLQRALKIHLWTLNRQQAERVMRQLIEINRQLDNQQMVQSLTEQLERLNLE